MTKANLTEKPFDYYTMLSLCKNHMERPYGIMIFNVSIETSNCTKWIKNIKC